MLKVFLEELRCSVCRSSFLIEDAAIEGEEIIEGRLRCRASHHTFPVINGIPRFGSVENYASAFGLQWNIHPKTQLDSASHTTISRDRFFQQTGWSNDLRGQKILEVGCGMGRFTEIVLQTGATCYSFDFSTAVDAAKMNFGTPSNYFLAQASIYEPPFPKEFFDKVFCFGVLQHTPNVRRSFHQLVTALKPGGELAFDVYAAPFQWFLPKRVLRPIGKYLDPERLYRMVRAATPTLLKISDAIGTIPKVGQVLRHAVPVANYRGRYPLSEQQIQEWAILDTFDQLNPRYDQPQRASVIRRWMSEEGLDDVQVARNVGLVVGRASKPLGQRSTSI